MSVENFKKTVVKSTTINGRTTTVKVTVEASGDSAVAQKLVDEAKADMERGADSALEGFKASIDEAFAGIGKSMKDPFRRR